jgi:hypothetical protein
VAECFDAVKAQHWYLKLITREQVGVGFDIDLLQRLESNAARVAHHFLHFFAKLAAGPGV